MTDDTMIVVRTASHPDYTGRDRQTGRSVPRYCRAFREQGDIPPSTAHLFAEITPTYEQGDNGTIAIGGGYFCSRCLLHLTRQEAAAFASALIGEPWPEVATLDVDEDPLPTIATPPQDPIVCACGATLLPGGTWSKALDMQVAGRMGHEHVDARASVVHPRPGDTCACGASFLATWQWGYSGTPGPVPADGHEHVAIEAVTPVN